MLGSLASVGPQVHEMVAAAAAAARAVAAAAGSGALGLTDQRPGLGVNLAVLNLDVLRVVYGLVRHSAAALEAVPAAGVRDWEAATGPQQRRDWSLVLGMGVTACAGHSPAGMRLDSPLEDHYDRFHPGRMG